MERAPVTEQRQEKDEAEHLVVMVNGLNGCYTNWNVLKEALQAGMGNEENKMLFYASQANRRLRTFSGINMCAERLSEELMDVMETCPNLRDISFLVHSMGGLIGRYAIGVNFDPEKRTVFGLHPRHFMSIATPHLGCDVEGESQVPFLGWIQSIPIVGPILLRPLIKLIAPFIMKHVYRRTGRQLFLLDGEADRKDPLICRLAQDIPGEGHFLSSLKEFKTRTCYANVRHDGLVGWENASLRRTTELPERVDAPLGSGITYRSDDIKNALWSSERNDETLPDDESRTGKGRRQRVEFMLKRLQLLPWCRIDICFRNPMIPMLAHTHIQVTRKWIDRIGLPVSQHIASTFAQLESLVSDR